MDALRDGIVASEGARLGYRAVYLAGPPREPLAEEFEPRISAGERNKVVLVEPFDGEEAERERVFLVKNDDPDQAYNLIGKPCKLLDHHGTGWGQIDFGVVLPRVRDENTTNEENGFLKFRAPPPEEAKLVAIKKLNKSVVKNYLDRGGHEDPYKEISRMQEIGDDLHVLSCVEALEDEDFLYIVTPYCSEGSLLENLPLNSGYTEATARALFKNILEILLYLERHGIFHHDLSPDNFLFFEGRLLLFDFAMSIRIPREEDGRRYLITPQGVFGTMPCQAPEVFFNRAPFDGVGADLWSAAVTLYSLLTGKVLYRLPHPSDILFKYYILAGGLAPGLNERLVEILEATFRPGNDRDQENLMMIAMANLTIQPNALELLINLLKFNPAERWTLMETIESRWVQNNTE